MKRVFLVVSSLTLLFAACNNNAETSVSSEKKDTISTTMNEKETREVRNRKVVLALVEGFNAQDIQRAFKDYSNDAVDYLDGSGAPLKGRDTVVKSYVEFFNAFTHIKGENVHIAADGDWVMSWVTWSGTWSKALGKQKATGKSFKVQDVDVFKFDENGKIVEHHSIQPFSTIAHQVGIKM